MEFCDYSVYDHLICTTNRFLKSRRVLARYTFDDYYTSGLISMSVVLSVTNCLHTQGLFKLRTVHPCPRPIYMLLMGPSLSSAPSLALWPALAQPSTAGRGKGKSRRSCCAHCALSGVGQFLSSTLLSNHSLLQEP